MVLGTGCALPRTFLDPRCFYRTTVSIKIEVEKFWCFCRFMTTTKHLVFIAY